MSERETQDRGAVDEASAEGFRRVAGRSGGAMRTSSD